MYDGDFGSNPLLDISRYRVIAVRRVYLKEKIALPKLAAAQCQHSREYWR